MQRDMALRRQQALEAGKRLYAAVESGLPAEPGLRLEVRAELPGADARDAMTLSLRVGEHRLYVVRSVREFLETRRAGGRLDFGKGFTYMADWMRFSPEEERFLDVLEALCPALPAQDEPALRKKIAVPPAALRLVLERMTGLCVRASLGETEARANRILPMALPVHGRIEGNSRQLLLTLRYPPETETVTPDAQFVWTAHGILHVPEEQRMLVREVLGQGEEGVTQFVYPTNEADRVFGEVVPFLKRTGVVEIDPRLEKHLIRLPLQPAVYLDREGGAVAARVEFRYGERRINPFAVAEGGSTILDGKLILRDGAAERRVLDLLGAAGFRLRQGMIWLDGTEAIYRFVTEGAAHLREVCEVYLSREFLRMTPRRPMLRGQMRMNGGHLELVFEEEETPPQEILTILEALARARQYVRLRDGTFLDLTGMDEWKPLAESVTEAAAQEGVEPAGNVLRLRAYRAAYLTTLLGGADMRVDDSVEEMHRRLSGEDAEPPVLPEGLQLRPYQKEGFRWLRQLDRLHMGGVLADDMGLGKTVEMIALFLAEQRPGEISLVVAPTSLVYNWQQEIRRFAPSLRTAVMGGTAAQREAALETVRAGKGPDVLITSYPLIRRDIALMREIRFRFAVLDEAQHIKNATSLGASAVKQIQADSRFALTGTPMENGLGELWSIFDFVLPGYLLSYGSFMRKYQDGERLEELRGRIRPFLMRRLKKEVLDDLPEKLERVMTTAMTPEQEKVYQAARLCLKGRVERILGEKGLNRGRTEVLAAITELRQICCHPALVLPDYAGGSGKIDLLLDLLPGAVGHGHRLLIFSQFASMLRILRQQLEAEGYRVLYLDGETPPARRPELTEQFNAGTGDIFLISREAGGVGLNLTGADMVVHYDPWWNPAAEDQATDRAYRIGQTRNVEVVRLVTHSSIEEQVVELGQRKRALFDQLITPGSVSITGLKEADIRALFA